LGGRPRRFFFAGGGGLASRSARSIASAIALYVWRRLIVSFSLSVSYR